MSPHEDPPSTGPSAIPSSDTTATPYSTAVPGWTLVPPHARSNRQLERTLRERPPGPRSASQDAIAIIDMNGNLVHGCNVQAFRQPKLFRSGSVLPTENRPESNPTGIYSEGPAREFDWDGELVWESSAPVASGARAEAVRLANGNTIFLYKMRLPDRWPRGTYPGGLGHARAADRGVAGGGYHRPHRVLRGSAYTGVAPQTTLLIGPEGSGDPSGLLRRNPTRFTCSARPCGRPAMEAGS